MTLGVRDEKEKWLIGRRQQHAFPFSLKDADGGTGVFTARGRIGRILWYAVVYSMSICQSQLLSYEKLPLVWPPRIKERDGTSRVSEWNEERRGESDNGGGGEERTERRE